MGNGGEGGDKDKRNGVSPGYFVQGIRSVDVIIWDRELSGDGVHDKSTRGIPSLVNQKYCGDDGVSYKKRLVGVAPVS